MTPFPFSARDAHSALRPCPSVRWLAVGVSLLAAVGAGSMVLSAASGCAEKKKNANTDMQKNQSSLMDQMDKIAAQEEARQAEATKKAEAETPKTPASSPDEPAPTKPAEKPPS